MNRREEQLDRFIDQLNAGQRPSIPARADREFVSVAATLQHLHRARHAFATAPRLAEPQRQPFNRLAAAALALTLVAVLGITALALRGSAPGDSPETAEAIGADIAETPAASPAVTVVLADRPSPAWRAELQPIGESQIAGGVSLMPTGSDTYEMSVSSYGMETPRSLTWTLMPGACADQTAASIEGDDILLSHTTASAFRLTLQDDWLDAPLILIAHDTASDTRHACVDLPVAEARARQPLPGSQATNVLIEPEPGQDIEVNARGWMTESGDVLLRIEAASLTSDMNLMWNVATGSCEALHDPVRRYTEPRQGLYRANAPAGSQGQYALSLILSREWLDQPLTITAYGNGGGPFAACGDVPDTLLIAE